MAARRIELPPALTDALIGLGKFAGRHVAEGVKRTRSSALREVRDMLRRASEIADAASNEDDEHDDYKKDGRS
jgi:hypothetical protein